MFMLPFKHEDIKNFEKFLKEQVQHIEVVGSDGRNSLQMLYQNMTVDSPDSEILTRACRGKHAPRLIKIPSRMKVTIREFIITKYMHEF